MTITGTMFVWIAAGVGLALGVAGIGLFWRGMRGRRVDDHPHCRRCGYDLYGGPIERVVCTECGADLKAKRAIRVGTFMRRGRSIAAGVVMLAVLLTGAGLVTTAKLRGLDPYKYKPTWMLHNEWRAGDTRAFDEIYAKVMDGKVSGGAMNRLVDAALADLEAMKPESYNRNLSAVIEKSRHIGRLDKVRWERYLRCLVFQAGRVRPVVRRGDVIPYWIFQRNWRVSNLGLYSFEAEFAMKDGPYIDLPRRVGSQLHTGDGSGSPSVVPDPGMLAQLADGPQNLVFEITLTAKASDGSSTDKVKIDIARPYDLIPPDRTSASAVVKPELRSAMRKSVTTEIKDDHVFVNIKQPPVAVAFNVIARSGDAEVFVGVVRITGLQDGGGISGVAFKKLDRSELGLGSIDVILRPNPEAAVETVGILEFWGEDIVFENVSPGNPGTPAVLKSIR